VELPPNCFSSEYTDARSRFLDAAHAAGASVETFAATHLAEPVWTDAAWLGRSDATNVLVMVSGTHGQEAFAGSAVQIAWMAQRVSLPDHVGVLLVHAINPYGFKYLTRTTENNVDLNRNFIDFASPRPALHPAFRDLHAAMRITAPTQECFEAVHAALDALKRAYGAALVGDLLAAGQYVAPDGLYYGGRQAEWSRRTLEAIARQFLQARSKVAIIDWHVGLGEYAKPFFLCFNEAGTALRARACQWWGEERVSTSTEGFDTGQVPNYQGLLVDGIGDLVAPAQSIRTVIEFGTYSNREMTEALAVDRWLRFEASPGDPRCERARGLMMDRFYPADAAWRAGVLSSGLTIAGQALSGLEGWH